MSNANRYPIILAHGIARFDFLRNFFSDRFEALGLNLAANNDGLHYFKGIAGHLRANGFDVHHSSVSFAAGVERRAQDLRNEVQNVLNATGKQKVHIIAHSMGGLDARHMIVDLAMGDRVASLTTIGTPHLGTSFANWGLSNQGDEFIRIVGNIIDLAGFKDLTLEACANFNARAEGQEATNSIVYQTYAGSQDQNLIFTPLQQSWEIINRHEGSNDGLVSTKSQAWQPRLTGSEGTAKEIKQNVFPVPVDHLNEVGWWDLSELRAVPWWRTNIFTAAKDYELRIKNVYLDIASHLTD